MTDIVNCKCRYLCERCGGSGKQENGSFDPDTSSYTGKAGKCQLCSGEGYLGYIVDSQAATKAAQVAAIRQRLGDIATGAAYGGDRFALPNAIIDVFGCDVDGITPAPEPRTLDSLAAWLWERGVRG